MSGKLIFAAGALFAALAFSSSANALTMKECSVKYQAAKADGSAANIKWNDFRARFCGTDAAAEEAAEEEVIRKTATTREPEAPTIRAPRGVKFPRAISRKYASEPAFRARLHTCADAYRENKEDGTLADLKWIQKGGGYWSLCNTALKVGS